MRTQPAAACLLAALAATMAACQESVPGNATDRPAAPLHVQDPPAVTTPVRQAVSRLAAEAPIDRAEALRQLVAAINQNAAEVAYINQIVALIQRNIAGQLRELSRVEDPEARMRLAEVLTFNEALSHFSVDMLELPPADRQAMLAWGLDPAHVGLVTKAWSNDPDVRAQGARDLAAQRDPQSERLLVRLIDDINRAVALSAMDSAADRAPTEPLVDALWKRAIEYPLRQYGYNWGFQQKRLQAAPAVQAAPKTVNVHGRAVQVQAYDLTYARAQDGDFATEILIAWKSPLVEARLNALFDSFSESSADPNGYRFQLLSPNYGGASQYLMRLVEAYRPRAFVPFLMSIAAGVAPDGYTQQINNQSYRMGSRIEALALVVQFTDQNREDYGLTRFRNWGNRWLIVGDDNEEEAAAKKLRTWWTAHYKDYGVKDAKLPEPGSIRGGFRGRGDFDDGCIMLWQGG